MEWINPRQIYPTLQVEKQNVLTQATFNRHISGVISHGHRKHMTYVDVLEYPHDSNLSMNIILKVLYTLAQSNRNSLPPVLFLQADNCFRENKNKYLLALCELFVHLRIFKEVHLSFLFVGHTH